MGNYPDVDEPNEDYEDEPYDYDDSMDGEFDSAMTSVGWGEDESYNHWAEEF
jgi:hypothetical protein